MQIKLSGVLTLALSLYCDMSGHLSFLMILAWSKLHTSNFLSFNSQIKRISLWIYYFFGWKSLNCRVKYFQRKIFDWCFLTCIVTFIETKIFVINFEWQITKNVDCLGADCYLQSLSYILVGNRNGIRIQGLVMWGLNDMMTFFGEFYEGHHPLSVCVCFVGPLLKILNSCNLPIVLNYINIEMFLWTSFHS